MMVITDRRLMFNFDWIMFLSLLSLSAAGIVAIWSTTGEVGLHSYFGRQILYLGIGLAVFFALLKLDYHLFSDYITFIYISGIVSLILVLFFGRSVSGNKSWIDIGVLSFQPSELMKIIVIIALARYYAELELECLGFKELLIGGMIVFVPTLLVVLQGDLGTALMFLPVYAVLSCLAGIRRKHVLAMLIIVVAAAPIAWFLMHGYQKDRIQTAFNPANDPHRVGYQTIQSAIAIGSGQFLGKGFRQGTQGHLGFLPARHTDFVFAVLAEEKGFLGGITILGLFMLVIMRLYRAACEAKDTIGAMIVSGILSLLLVHITVNLGMVLGLLPVVGIPLPFVSAGGSSLVSYYIGMGLCMGIRMRRYFN
ncbi:MAG TPA: rod shape-determining protein RodA [Acidobacteriota bacterium]|nr:rod shape-determining protein RodA [Acidobacteriota bacterium]